MVWSISMRILKVKEFGFPKMHETNKSDRPIAGRWLSLPQHPKVDTLVISRYPITANELSRLASYFDGPFEVLIVSIIVKGGFKSLFRQLRRTRCNHLVLFLDNEADEPLLPVLLLMTALIRANNKSIIIGKQPRQNISAFASAKAMIDVISATIVAAYRSSIAIYRCHRLLHKPRIDIIEAYLDRDSMMLIKFMLWFGVQSGGAATHFLGIVGAAHRAGKNVAAISSELMPFALNESTLEFRRLVPRKAYITPRELNHFSAQTKFVQILKKAYPDYAGVIYQRLSAGSYVGVELSRYYGMPLVVEYNGSERWLSENWGTPYTFVRAIENVERLMLDHAHVIVAISDVLKNELMSRGVEADRIVVVNNGYDPTSVLSQDDALQARQAMRETLGLSKDAVVFCFVGTFGPWHGVEVIARAINHFFARASRDEMLKKAHFLFVGDGVKRREVEEIVRSQIDLGRVTFAGSVASDAINGYLAASDVCLLPTIANKDGTEFFGSPTKLFEYISAGKPVIATNIGQAAEILKGAVDVDCFAETADCDDNMQCGIILPPGRADKLADAFMHVVHAPTWRAAAGVHAAARAKESYSWDHSFAKIEQSVDDFLSQQTSTPRVRVLVNGLHSKAGGGLTYLTNMLPRLAAHPNLKIHVCLSHKQSQLLGDAISGVSVELVHRSNMGFCTLLLYEQVYLPILARRVKADVTFSPANYGPIFSRNTVLLMRNALSVALVERRLMKLAYWKLLSWATFVSRFMAKRVISVSEYADETTKRRKSDRTDFKTKIIPHGVSEKFYCEDITRSENRILAVSNIYVQKNFHTLLNAMVWVRKTCPDATLTIVGAPLDFTYHERLVQMIVTLGLTECVSMSGYKTVDELRQLYSTCAIFVFPSTVETFGNPLVEAMACGAPIACSNTAAMPGVVGDAASLFDPLDEEDMAEKIIQLLQDPVLRQMFGTRALERAKDFSWDNAAKSTVRVLIDASR